MDSRFICGHYYGISKLNMAKQFEAHTKIRMVDCWNTWTHSSVLIFSCSAWGVLLKTATYWSFPDISDAMSVVYSESRSQELTTGSFWEVRYRALLSCLLPLWCISDQYHLLPFSVYASPTMYVSSLAGTCKYYVLLCSSVHFWTAIVLLGYFYR